MFRLRTQQSLLRLTCFFISIIAAMMMAGCGSSSTTVSDSSNNNTPTPVATTLSGTAAAGAPIIGKVTIKDSSSPAVMKTVPIEADGKYIVDVSDLKAPYMVRADGYVGGNEYHLFSAGTAADVGGTINITPLTDLIIANIAKTVASDYFNSNFASTLTTAALKTQTDALTAKLQPILAALGVSSSIDLLRASFNTDHTGLDAALDVLKVDTGTTGVATITNIITQQQITSTISTGTYSGTLTDTAGVATAATDIQLISAGFKKFSDLFVTSLPGETNATLLSLFDSATFLQGGQNLASFLPEISTDKGMIGISFTNISIKSMNAAANTAFVGFDVMKNGKPENDAPEAWYMIKKNGVWYMQGDQRIAEVKIRPRADRRQPTDTFLTGLDMNIEDRGGKGITSAVVKGKGLPATGVVMVNQINNDWFTFEGTPNGGGMYIMDDTHIGAIADVGEVYTVELYQGTTKLATYFQKLRKRPYLNTELTSAIFPTMTSPTLSQFRSSFSGGSATVTWTLPASLTNDWLEVSVHDDAGNSVRYEASLLPADRTKSFTITPITSTGQTFTATQGSIWLNAWDSYGRSVATSVY